MMSTSNDNILLIDTKSPNDVLREISSRVRRRRLELDFTQKAFAVRCGIPLATYRRFELTGEISLRNLVLVAMALDMVADFDGLFAGRRYRNIEDVINADRLSKRKRGRRGD